MEYKRLSVREADLRMRDWIDNESVPILTGDESAFRDYLVKEYWKIKAQTQDVKTIDILFGISVYKYLSATQGFTMRVASDDDYWRYVALMIIPDLVSDRWGKTNESHFYSRGTRIWPRVLWWFVYLGLQDDDPYLEKTKTLLMSSGFTTDEILNMIERAGRKGIYIDVYREILKQYSKIPQEERKRIADLCRKNKDASGKRVTLFRKIMILNTARQVVVDPYLMGVDRYVKSILSDLGVKSS